MKILRVVVVAIALGVLTIPLAIPPFESLTVSLYAQRELAQLQGLSELKSWFNSYKGHPRLILLLSPT